MMDELSSSGSYFDVRQYGARGDASTLCTSPIQQAIDDCHAAGGGTVVLPPGTYVSGTLYLKSHVVLHLCSGATLLGSPNTRDYNGRHLPRECGLHQGEYYGRAPDNGLPGRTGGDHRARDD